MIEEAVDAKVGDILEEAVKEIEDIDLKVEKREVNGSVNGRK